ASGQLLFVRDSTLFSQPFDPGNARLQGEATRIADAIPVLLGGTHAGRTGFSVSENGVLAVGYGPTADTVLQLWSYDRTGKQLTKGGTANYRGVDLSHDGRRLAVHRHNGESGGDIWIYDLERETDTRFTFDDAGDDASPIWSPNDAFIAFTALRNG